MYRLWRTGFARDAAGLLLVTILAGSLIAGGIAFAVERYFAGTVKGLVGEYGEYDVIVHVREEARGAAADSLRSFLQDRVPGARMKQGITVAGKANFFVAVPSQIRSQHLFSNLPRWMGSLPGYAGMTYITEPSVVVRSVHPSLRRRMTDGLAAQPGVLFVFQDGNNLVAVLDSPTRADSVYEAAQRIADRYRILEIRFPFEYRMADAEQSASAVEKALQGMWGSDAARDVTASGQQDSTGAFVTALREMKRFLVGYATHARIALSAPDSVVVGDLLELAREDDGQHLRVRITAVNGQEAQGYVESGNAEPFLATGATAYTRRGGERRSLGSASLVNERLQLVEAIDTSLELLDQLQILASEADTAVSKAGKTLETFEAALIQLETVQDQVRQINEELTTKGKVDTSSLLLSVLLSRLIKQVEPEAAAPKDLQQVDVAGMQGSLREMSDRLAAMAKMDMGVVKREIGRVRDNLPRLTDDEIGDSLRLLESYLEGQVVPGDHLQILVDSRVDVEQSAALVRTVLRQPQVTLFASPGALVSPDPRATLFSILGQVRETVAGMGALVLTLLALILDHATLFSAMRLLEMGGASRAQGHWAIRRWFNGIDACAAATGSILLAGLYMGSRAGVPGIAVGHVVLIGAVLGWLVGRLCRRISPVDGEEVAAGLALGLSSTQVMREIVLPAGRPGLMLLLNRPRQAFQ